MTQAPQAVPAGWYPSPDGAPVHRWWDGTMWTDATHPPQAPAQPDPVERVEPVAVEPGPAASGWPAPAPPSLGPLALVTRVFVALAGLGLPLAWGAQAWRLADPPEWLTENVAVGLTGAASGLLLVAGLFWMVWQYRVAKAFPPGTPRRTPGWQVLSWLVPVGLWWLPYQNVADLTRLSTGRRPGWLPAWWALWVVGSLGAGIGAALASTSPGVGTWVAIAGGLVLLGAVPFAWLLVTRVTAAIPGTREHPDA